MGARMRIAVDLLSCQTDSRNRGIGRYSLSLVEAMSRRLGDDGGLFIGLDAADPHRLRETRHLLRDKRIRAEAAAVSYPNTAISDLSPAVRSAAALLRSRFYGSVDPDIVLVSSLFEFGSRYNADLDHAAMAGIPTAVIAYDIIPLLFPERYLPAGEFMSSWYEAKIEQFRKFDLFLAISEATRDDLISHLGIDAKRIRTIGAGLDACLAAPSESHDRDMLGDLGIHDPFVLMVGNTDWRKNCMGALEAYAALPANLRKRYQLVFTQVGEDVVAALDGSHSHLRSRVVIAGKVCEATLAQLYARCRVFFFPSFYEGFGLPVLEAMAQGAPVLSSDQGALPEVVHDSRVLFDPRDADAACGALRHALEDDDFCDSLRMGAREHALTFTWDRCAEQAISALSEWVASHPRQKSVDWKPSASEVSAIAGACVETGPTAEPTLRNGLQAIASGGQRRILVDISEVVRLDARSGIQRVVRNYLIGLIGEASERGQGLVEPIHWTDKGVRYAREYARSRLGLALEGADDEVDVRANDLVFMVDSSWWSPGRFDGLNERVWAAGGEVVWMVYDLVPVYWPQYCDPGMPPAFRSWLEHVVKHSDGMVCISDATRDDLERFIDELGIPAARRPWSRSLHLGSDLESGRVEQASPDIVGLCEKQGTRPWLVALGTVEPRKDYATILAAFELLWLDGVDVGLVIIGKRGWNVEALSQQLLTHPEFGSRLHWLEGLPDGDVQYLLDRCHALVQASIAEGFGLPVVEAGSRGIPLVLSDIPVFREIAGSEATYFATSDPKALATAISSSIEHGWRRPSGIRTLTWRESSQKLLNILWRNADAL
ncbi:MAG TPA: glycosyltransferase family 1 protein [Lysobacter sp.]